MRQLELRSAVASARGDASLNSRLSGTDEYRLKNVTIKTFLPDPGVHHTPSSCMRRAAGGGSCMRRCVGSPATPREARPFHGLIERDRALRAAFLPEVREFISQGELISGWLCARRGAVAPGPYLGPQHGWKVRDIARYCAILCDTFRYLAINHELGEGSRTLMWTRRVECAGASARPTSASSRVGGWKFLFL